MKRIFLTLFLTFLVLSSGQANVNVRGILGTATPRYYHPALSSTSGNILVGNWTSENGNSTYYTRYFAQKVYYPAGTYSLTTSFSSTSRADVILYLYGRGSSSSDAIFDPANPLTNGLVANDDFNSGATLRSEIKNYNISTAGWYTVVITTKNPNDTLAFSIDLGTTNAIVGSPSIQASNVNFTSVSQNTLTTSWTRGNGDYCAVFVKATTDGGDYPAPVNGTNYTANTAFGSGSQIGSTGWYCVYNGTGTSVSLSALSGTTTYKVMVVEYSNSSGSNYYYNTATGTNDPMFVATTDNPYVISTSISSIGTTTATGNGYLDPGSSTINARGYAWSTSNTTPTVADASMGEFNSPYSAGTYSEVMTVSVASNTFYYARAYIRLSTSDYYYGSSLTFITLPDAPSEIGATPSGSSASFSWTAPSGTQPLTYNVELYSDAGYSTLVQGDYGITSTGDVINSLSSGATYYYRVSASNATGTSSWVDGSFSTTAFLSLTSDSLVNVSTTSATGYGTIVSTGGSNVTSRGFCWSATNNPPTISDNTASETGTYSTGSFSESITGLTPNTKYYVRGFATNNGGSSYSYGDLLTLITLSNSPGSSPVSGISTSGFTVNWTAPSGNGSQPLTYTVQISSNASFTDTLSQYTGIGSSTTSQAFSGLDPNTVYYYRVAAVNDGGTSNWLTGSVTTIANPPTSVSASNIGKTSLDLSWTAPSGSATDTYNVRYSLNNGSGPYTYVYSVSGTTTSITGLSVYTDYYFEVQTVNAGGSSDWSSPIYHAQTLPNWSKVGPNSDGPSESSSAGGHGPNGMEDVNISFNHNSTFNIHVTINWTGDNCCWTNTSGNNLILLIQSPGGSWQRIGDWLHRPSDITPYYPTYYTQTYDIALNGRETAGTYTLRAAILDLSTWDDRFAAGATYACGTCDTYNSMANHYDNADVSFTLSDVDPPTVVTISGATASSNTAASASGNITSLGGATVTERGIAFRTDSAGSGNFGITGSFGTGIYSQSMTSLKTNTKYYYRAYATNAGGTAFGAEYQFYTYSNTTTVASADNITSSSFRANWNAVTNDGAEPITYQIQVSKFSDFSDTPDNYTGITSLYKTITTFKGNPLVPNTKYYYRVRVSNLAGTTAWSSSTNTTTLTCAPTSLTATNRLVYGYTANWSHCSTQGPESFSYKIATYLYGESEVPVDLVTGVSSSQTTFDVFDSESLTPETHYYYVVYGNNASGDGDYSNQTAFWTLSLEPERHANLFYARTQSPSQINFWFESANQISNCDGYLLIQRIGSYPNWTPTDGGGYSVGQYFGDNKIAAIITDPTQATLTLNGLLSNYHYYYTLVPYNWNGYIPDTYNYLTSPTIPTAEADVNQPVISGISATSITQTGATINSTVDSKGSPTNISVQYGLSTSYGTTATVGSQAYNGYASYNTGITGLQANMVYHYRIVATNYVGTTYSSDMTFTTPDVNYAPTTQDGYITFSNLRASSCDIQWRRGNGAGSFVVVKANSAITSSDLPTSQTRYTTYNRSYVLAPSIGSAKIAQYGTSNILYLIGLQASTTYYIQVCGYNGNPANGTAYFNRNTGTSNPGTFRTPRARDNEDGWENAVEGFSISKIHPNPVSDAIEFTLDVSTGGDYNISVFDLNGNKVLEYTGERGFAEGLHTIKLDSKSLVNGSYTLSVSSGSSMAITKFVVAR